MLLRSGSVALAAVAGSLIQAPSALAQDDSKSTQSTFVTEDGALSFAFSVPADDLDDYYFTLRVERSYSWGAVGLGSEHMPGALFFLIHDNRNGDSITFSPRLAYGHYEPFYYPEFEYTALNGTGIVKDEAGSWMVIQARCTKHCRSWPGHDTAEENIDIYSPNEKVIFALGTRESFASDLPDEGIKYHERFGSFEINMDRTRGAKEPPFLDAKSKNEGAKLIEEKGGKSDVGSILHAVLMIIAIVGLMPLGTVLIRLGKAARWHALNQTAAMVFVFIGFAMGIVTSAKYQRSMNFRSAHQILGIVLTACFLIQLGVGFFNHQQYRRTQVPSPYNIFHVWLGRLLIVLAIMNGFFGFTFALNRRYGMVLAGLIIGVCFISLFIIIGRQWLNKGGGRAPRLPYNDTELAPTQRSQPWRNSQPASDLSTLPAEPPPRYESTQEDSQNIGLRPVSPWRRTEPPYDETRSQTLGLGSLQTPRELL